MSATAATLAGRATEGHAHPELAVVDEPQTGLGNEWFGLVLFLVSEAMLFAALFAQYFYVRINSAQWPPPGTHVAPAFPLAAILTGILVLSGFTAHFAQTAIRKNDQEGTRAWLLVSILLGVVFLAGQVYEYSELIAEGLTIGSGIYGSVFYVLTGLHGIHVSVGVLLLIGVLVRAIMGHFSPTNHFGLEGTVLYWHFVDIVWFALYVSVYIL